MGPRDAASQERGPVVTSLTLFAGGLTGLWRSTDWGGKWERVSEGTANGALPETGAVRAVLALVRRVYVAADKGLFLSEDFGQTWKRLGVEGETPVTESVLSVMPSRYPQADPTVFVGTERGLLKSVDGGKTFAPTLLRGTPVTRLEWPGPALIATTGHGVVVSEDGGSTFSSGAGLPAGPPQSLAVSSFFARDPVLFTSVGRAGVYRSRDGARTWEFVGLDGKLVADLVWLGPILYAATDHGLFRSDDAGRTWTAGAGLAARACTRLLFPLAPDSGLEAFLITDQGIVHTADGGAHWQETGLLGDGRLCLATFPPVGREPMRKTK
jgi:photosystem II stability/assembly factor-like uncharacterized protein